MSLIRLKEISVKLFVREGGGCGFAGVCGTEPIIRVFGYCLRFLLSKNIKSMNSFIQLTQKKQKLKNIVIT